MGTVHAMRKGEWRSISGLRTRSTTITGVVTQSFDVTTFNAAGRFLYRIAPRTRLLTELRYTTFDYKTNNLDSSEVRLLVGATWDLAASTSGTVKVGQVRKDFKQSTLSDFSGVNVEAAVRWMPRTYSTVELLATRQPSDSTGAGLFTVDTTVGAVWNHRWQSFLSSRALLTYLELGLRRHRAHGQAYDDVARRLFRHPYLASVWRGVHLPAAHLLRQRGRVQSQRDHVHGGRNAVTAASATIAPGNSA